MKTKSNFDKWSMSFNGPLTSFTLQATDGREWPLCREDLKRISKGDFTFDDGRNSIDVSAEDEEVIIAKCLERLSIIDEGIRYVDLLGGFYSRFEEKAEAFEPIGVRDLGRYFRFQGEPYVLLGARPRARTYVLAAKNLKTGNVFGFTKNTVVECLGIDANAKCECGNRDR